MMIFRRQPTPEGSKDVNAIDMSDQVSPSEWIKIAHQIAEGALDLVSLWADEDRVLMAIQSVADHKIRTVSIRPQNGHFPSVARIHAPAIRLERTIHDLFGYIGEGANDLRPWLDHGRWGIRRPHSSPHAASSDGDQYAFLTAEGEPLHQIPVGPVHAGIIEPGHFRFSANGETVVRLEERLGYVHKGVDLLMKGLSVSDGARLAGRISGDSTVAYAYAFACAVESAIGRGVSTEVDAMRALMAELERLANHFGDIGAICNDAAFSLMQGYCAVVRENILRACKICFGHRLMMDKIIPGGVSHDFGRTDFRPIRNLTQEIRKLLPDLLALYGDTSSLQARTVGTGAISTALVQQYAVGGVIGRASGRNYDARRDVGYGYYRNLTFAVGGSSDGDVDARIWVRFDEIKASLDIIEQITALRFPETRSLNPLEFGPSDHEGYAVVEGFRGDIFCWIRVNKVGEILRCHIRDPSWFQWPLLEYAIKGNIVADFPLCNKSFNCSYSGHDL